MLKLFMNYKTKKQKNRDLSKFLRPYFSIIIVWNYFSTEILME